jgi:AAA+ ATPase superfamily predicted ATPase
MAKIHDEERENRITNQVIVDCYDESEEMMGWYYYMYDALSFPMKAIANIPTASGKTVQKKVKIVKIDPDSEKGRPFRIGVMENGGRVISYISPEYLIRIEESPENVEIINDWLYWHDFELL